MNSMAKYRRSVLLPVLLCLFLSPSHHCDLLSPSPNQSSNSSLSPPVSIREDAEVSEDHSFPHEKNSSHPPNRTLQSDGTGQRQTPKTPPTPNRKLLQTGFPSYPPLSVAPGGVTCILFRARKMAISHYNHSAVDLTERTFGPSALVDTRDSTCSKDHAVLSLNFGDVEHLKGLVIRLEMSNIFYESTEQTWFTLDSIQILYNHELEAMFDAPEIYAPATHSYHCKHVSSLQKYDSLLVPNKVRLSEGGHREEEPRNAPSNWHITFTDFQIQAFVVQSGHFGSARDCASLLTPAILMGLVTSLILLLVLAYALHMVVHLKHIERYEEHKTTVYFPRHPDFHRHYDSYRYPDSDRTDKPRS